MKKLIVIIILALTINVVKAQENFKWDKVIEVQGTRDQLFSRAKMVLAKLYNNSEHVTKNSDKDAGAIFVRAQESVSRTSKMNIYIYDFKYELTILTKDNKIRVQLNNIRNIKASNSSMMTIAKIVPVSTTYPATNEKEGKKKFGLTQKSILKL